MYIYYFFWWSYLNSWKKNASLLFSHIQFAWEIVFTINNNFEISNFFFYQIVNWAYGKHLSLRCCYNLKIFEILKKPCIFHLRFSIKLLPWSSSWKVVLVLKIVTKKPMLVANDEVHRKKHSSYSRIVVAPYKRYAVIQVKLCPKMSKTPTFRRLNILWSGSIWYIPIYLQYFSRDTHNFIIFRAIAHTIR